jgi:hypothetical protein
MTRVKVTVVTAPACALCDHAEHVLARVAQDYELTVEKVSVEAERGRHLMIEHKIAFPPAVLLDDRAFSYGRLSERKLRRELERIGAAEAEGRRVR